MEMGDDKQICRLCLCIVSTVEAEAIGEKKKALLEVLLINADLHVTENAVACSRCMEELQSGFEFKSACLHVDNCISSFVDADGPVDIKEVFHGENRGTVMANVNLENRQICRLCMSLIADEALKCNTSLKDTIAKCLPEVDIHTVHEPLICGLCFSQMKKLNEFMKTCRGVEQRINDYCQASTDHAIPVSVSLNDLLKFKDLRTNFDSDVLKDLKKEDATSLECEEIYIKTELESVGEMGDSGPSGACINSEESGSLKRKRQIRQFTSKERMNFSSDGHMARHKSNKKFACQECTYKTDWKTNLARHMGRHKDKSEVEMHKCEKCEFETRYKGNMINHMLKHRDPKAGRKFQCDKCPYETNFKQDLCRHNLRHDDKLEVEMHRCENCEYETRYKGNMTQHIIKKHRDPKAERKFKCHNCPYETDFSSNLHKHNLIHTDKSEVEMHKCENWEYETCHKGNMMQHMMKKHPDPKAGRKFNCDKCPYGTNFKRDLGRHNLIHMGKSEVEMHQCEKCDFQTKYKSNMVKHKLKHRDPRAERKFKCDKCHYVTDIKCYLRTHNLIHKDKSEVEMHKCENCEFESKYKHNLIQHMRKHRSRTGHII